MSGEYITAGLRTDPNELNLRMIADYKARVPGWAASESDPLYVNLGIQAYRHSILLDVASQVLDTIYRYEGRSIFDVIPDDPTHAVADAIYTVHDTNGPYLIPAGTRVDVGPAQIRFKVESPVTVPNGSLTGQVRLIAEDPGADGTGLSGPLTFVDPLDDVASGVIDGISTAGRDGETNPQYMDRLNRRGRRLTPKVVTAIDLAEAVLDIAGVGASMVIDNYIPAGPGGVPAAQTNVPGAATVIPRTLEGADVPTDVHDAILLEVEAARLDDVQIHVANPTRTTVGVTWTAASHADADPAAVEAAGDAALEEYLASAIWGLFGPTGQQRWRETTVVRYSELIHVLNQVPDLDHVDSVQINALAVNTNLTLPGPGALTVPGAMSGTVTAP